MSAVVRCVECAPEGVSKVSAVVVVSAGRKERASEVSVVVVVVSVGRRERARGVRWW
jgi:hypothetical protein